MPGKIKKVAKKVAARQEERKGRTVSTKEARARAKGIIQGRKAGRPKVKKAVVARGKRTGVSATNKANAIVQGRSAPKAPKKTQSKVSKVAQKIRGRHGVKGDAVNKTASRQRAKDIIARRKK
jgi:hypothetical protein